LAIEPPIVPRWRTAGSPIMPARSASAGIAAFHGLGIRHRMVGRHRPDGDRAGAVLDADEVLDLRHVDDVLGPGKSQLHGWNKRVPAGEKLRLLFSLQQARGLPHRGRAMNLECVHFCSPGTIPYFVSGHLW
jgi:hypothetical protein